MVNGNWQPSWAKVVEAFAANFAESGEQGAGLAVYRRGELVLHIWGGQFDNRLTQQQAQPWSEKTIVNIFSAGKGWWPCASCN